MPSFLLSSVINRDPLTCELSDLVLSSGTRETASHNVMDLAAWTLSPCGGWRMALNSRWPLHLDKCFRSSYGKGKWSPECLGGFSSEPNNLTMSMASIFKSLGPLVPRSSFKITSSFPAWDLRGTMVTGFSLKCVSFQGWAGEGMRCLWGSSAALP